MTEFVSPKLPWVYGVIAVMVNPITNETFVTTQRERHHGMEFVVHRMDIEGNCHGGSYCETWQKAFDIMLERVYASAS